MRLALLALAVTVAIPSTARPAPGLGGAPGAVELPGPVGAGELPGPAVGAAELPGPPGAAADASRSAAGLPRWGLALGAGFPEFATASVVFRPLRPVRLQAGPSWNYFGWGLQGGVTLAPWAFAVTPVLSLDAGRFFASDLSFLASDGDNGAAMKPLLENVSYSYAGAAVGLEVGSPRGLTFSIRIGLSYVSIATHGTGTRSEADGSSVTLSDPSLNATLPSLKLGVQYWF
jgi:hypothetical protein